MSGTTNLTDLSLSGDIAVGGDLTLGSNSAQPVKVAKVALAAATGGGGILSWANPEGATILIDRFILDVTTQATGAATADIGVAANGTTSADTLIDGVDIGSAAILTDNISGGGTNGTDQAKVTSTQYVTGTASADPSGLVGNVYIYYTLL